MIISIISAVAKNGVIGNKNALPWHLPADFKYFKEKTLGKTIILGLNTFKSINEKPLPNRKHIILCNNQNYKAPKDCFLAKSIDEAIKIAENDPSASSGQKQEVFVCGGASVYKQFLPLANRLYLTYIHKDFEGDTRFPEFNIKDYNEIKREDYKADDKNKYNYSFVILEKI
ncbi:MAG: dihydrofolate reductase [Patescibacteria group bacterium]